MFILASVGVVCTLLSESVWSTDRCDRSLFSSFVEENLGMLSAL